MTDSLEQGTQGAATPEGSDVAGNQKGSSQPEYITVEQFSKIQEQIEALRRQMQSSKDKAVKRTEERLEGLERDVKTVLQTALKQGKRDISDVLAEIEESEEAETRELLRKMALTYKEGGFQRDERGSSTGGVDVEGVIQELELDKSDPRVSEFRTRQFASREEAYREAAKLLKLITKQPSEADRPSDVAKRQEYATKQEQLMAEYRERAKNLRGRDLIDLKFEMRKKGLQIS